MIQVNTRVIRINSYPPNVRVSKIEKIKYALKMVTLRYIYIYILSCFSAVEEVAGFDVSMNDVV